MRWRSFELDPDAPPEKDGDDVGLLARKYGTPESEARRMIDAMTTTAAAEGQAIGRSDVLQRLATEVGLDEVEVEGVLAGDAYADAVRADERQAQAYGIRGVPFFVLDGRYGVSGAQPAEVLVAALGQAYAGG